MEQAAEKFFACSDTDMAEYRAEQERNRPVDPKTLIKNQFVMSKSQAQPGKSQQPPPPCLIVCAVRSLVQKQAASATNDFQTSNNFYHSLTAES